MIDRLPGRSSATWRTRIVAGTFAGVLLALGLSARALDQAAKTDTVEAPRFEVDPAWPKPLPNNWMIGMAIGVGVDARDHVWIVHRQNTLAPTEVGADQNPPTADCCKAAPPVLEFDTDGTLLRWQYEPSRWSQWRHASVFHLRGPKRCSPARFLRSRRRRAAPSRSRKSQLGSGRAGECARPCGPQVRT